MKLFQSSIVIEASVSSVWPVLADVENWPRWAKSFTRIAKLDSGETGVGSRVTVKQPRLTQGNWEITEWSPGKSFKWVSRGFALSIIGDHVLLDQGRSCEFRQTLLFAGLVGTISAYAARSLIREYMLCEAEGLKAYCEADSACNV